MTVSSHTVGDADDLAGAEYAVGVELVPNAAVNPGCIVTAVGIDGCARRGDRIVRVIIGIDVFAEQRGAAPI